MRRSGSRRSIVREPEFNRGLKSFFNEVQQADRILTDWLEALARNPERGFAVQGAPDYLGLPIHTEQHSYLVIYWFDEDNVYCIGLRRVPSGVFRD